MYPLSNHPSVGNPKVSGLLGVMVLIAGIKIRSAADLGKMASQPLPSQGSPYRMRGGYFIPAFSAADMWAEWLHNGCLLGAPQHVDKHGQCRADGKMPLRVVLNSKVWFLKDCPVSQGPKKGVEIKVATSPLPFRGPTCGPSGCITPAVSGDPPKKGVGNQIEHFCFVLGTLALTRKK